MALLFEGLFALVFVWALGGYVARREPLQRDVAAMFSALAGLFVVDRYASSPTPPRPGWRMCGTVLMLAHPVLTLRLVRRIRPVPTELYAAAAVGGLGGDRTGCATESRSRRPVWRVVLA